MSIHSIGNGGLISSSGPLAGANTMRFSSKPAIFSATGAWGFYCYGYRFYDPGMQRWVKRDPIEERGGVNMKGFVRNSAPSLYAPLGLQHGQRDTDECKRRCHEWANKFLESGAGGSNFEKTLSTCLEGCDLNPRHIPGSPIPALRAPRPIKPPGRPLLVLAKECAKGLWAWFKS